MPSGRDRTASPDGPRRPAACRRSGPGRGDGWPRARRRRTCSGSCRPRCRNGSTRTRPAARQIRSRRRARPRCASAPLRDRSAAPDRERLRRPSFAPSRPACAAPSIMADASAICWRFASVLSWRRSPWPAASQTRRSPRDRPWRSTADWRRRLRRSRDVEFGDQRAARVGLDRRDRSRTRSHPEAMEGQHGFSLCGTAHGNTRGCDAL